MKTLKYVGFSLLGLTIGLVIGGVNASIYRDSLEARGYVRAARGQLLEKNYQGVQYLVLKAFQTCPDSAADEIKNDWDYRVSTEFQHRNYPSLDAFAEACMTQGPGSHPPANSLKWKE